MKNKTEKTSIRVSIELCVVGLIVIGIVLGACLLVDRYKTKRAPQHDTCAKCQHLFAKGSGKAVVFEKWFGNQSVTNTYCKADAPKYDRMLGRDFTIRGEGGVVIGDESYFVRGPEWVSVDKNGERLDKPKPCEREHVPPATNPTAFTNWITLTNIILDEWRWYGTNSPR